LTQPHSVSPTAETTPYGLAALEHEIQTLVGIPEGQRNDALNRSALDWPISFNRGNIPFTSRERLKNSRRTDGLTPKEVHATVIQVCKKDGKSAPKPKFRRYDGHQQQIRTASSLGARDSTGGEYPINALGPLLGDTVRAIVDIVQVPPALAAGSVLAVASLACRVCRCGTTDRDGYSRPLSLNILTIAESSERKSTSDSFALRAVKRREEELERTYQKETAIYLQKKLIYEKTRTLQSKNI